jgi:hypothetical protein
MAHSNPSKALRGIAKVPRTVAADVDTLERAIVIGTHAARTAKGTPIGECQEFCV